MTIFNRQRLTNDVFKIDVKRMRRGWYSDKYFENIRRLREKGILPTPKAEADDSYLGDVELAGLVGYEDWTGPKEHGPFPDIFKSKGINQKGLKSLMEEMQEYRRRGIL